MKKLVSAVLAFVMLTSMFTTASAATISKYTGKVVPNPLEFENLSVDVFSRESGSGDEYDTETLSLTMTSEDGIGVDYKTTLDMAPIRELFDQAFITAVLAGDQQAYAEFQNGRVTTSVSVVIDYPAAATINGDPNQVGGLISDNGIFEEVSRTVIDNRVTIKYKNNDTLKVSTLLSDVDTYLADLSFELADVVTYAEEGNHKVTVTLSGQTLFDFTSLDQTVIYAGQGSQYVTVAKDLTFTNHVLEVIPAVAPTCFEPGKTEGIICSTHNSYDCGAIGCLEPKVILAYNHMINSQSLKFYVKGIASTCTSTGIREHYTCSLCKSDFDSIASDVVVPHENYIIPKASHNEVTDDGFGATCAVPGYTDGKHCSVCGTVTVKQELIPVSSEHTNIVTIGTNKTPTCLEDGSASGQECRTCGKIFQSATVIPATGHDFGEWNIVTEATETTVGLKKRVCKNDSSHVETAEIPKRAHVTHIADPAKDVIVPATCTEPGRKTQYCYYCDVLVNEETIPALGHKLSHIAAIPATCSSTGTYEHYKCEVCSGKYRDSAATKVFTSVIEPVDSKNHPAEQTVTIPGIPENCARDGLADGLKCKACDTVLKKRTVIPKKENHSQYEASHLNEILELVPGQNATCTEAGVEEHYHCAVCNKDLAMDKNTVITESDFIIPVTGHQYGDPVITGTAVSGSDGRSYYYPATRTCQFCGEPINVFIPLDVDNCEHKVIIGEDLTETILWNVTKDATCTETGLKEKICSFCNEVVDTITIEKLAHNLVKIPSVEPTCREEGTAGYWLCTVCDKMFDAADVSREISAPEKLAKTEHDFRIIGNGNNKQCKYCKEVVHLKKQDKEGNDVDDIGVEVVKHGHIKHDETDIKIAEIIEEENKHETTNKVEIVSVVTIQEKEDVSPKLDANIPENAAVEKVVVDITIEKVTTYSEKNASDEYEVKNVDKEKVDKTDDFITIEIVIPPAMRDNVDFVVHRLHNGVAEKITTRENSAGEYIEIDRNHNKVILHVKNFSEYALVGYSEIVNIPENDYIPSGGSPSSFTIKFNANGGTVLESVVVKRGEKITPPVPTREGYIFAGWYTDNNFTKPFGVKTLINKNMTLYAKWIPVEECTGTESDNCPCLHFADVDPNMWYHKGVDYVLNNNMMVGVADGVFAPDLDVTRAMLVTVLWRNEGKPAGADTTFADLEEGLYYVDAVEWATENGVVTGYSDEVFAPNDSITREQLAAIIYRYAKNKGYDVSVGENTNILSYTDADQISEYAISAIQYAVGSGLMTGRTETTINPKANTTRAEMATILYRFYTENK